MPGNDPGIFIDPDDPSMRVLCSNVRPSQSPGNYGPLCGRLREDMISWVEGPRLLDSFNNTFRGVRLVGGAGTGPRFNNTPNLLYAEWGSDFSFSGIAYRELYDMDADPWQMTNLYDNWSRNHSRAHLVHQLANLTRRLYSCSGVGCL